MFRFKKWAGWVFTATLFANLFFPGIKMPSIDILGGIDTVCDTVYGGVVGTQNALNKVIDSKPADMVAEALSKKTGKCFKFKKLGRFNQPVENENLQMMTGADFEGYLKPYDSKYGASVTVNKNTPLFDDDQVELGTFEFYSDLDDLGRCGMAYAMLSKDLMPTEERGAIGHIRPSGWQTVKYDKSIISDMYLYNRCHLIAFCLAGENDNEKNLITGTRYFNVEGMLPYEEQVARYIEKTGHHVLYRVTPIYTGENLVADGVVMEAYSIEDPGCRFCVYVYNIQPGVGIDYATGNNWVIED